MRRLVAFGWLSVCALIALSACGSSKSDSPAGASGSGNSNGGGSNSSGGSVGSGTPNGGSTTVSFGGTGSSTGGSGSIVSCAETAQMGRLVPLDIFIMLDTSGSMLEGTTAAANAPTKWNAVRAALQTFLTDPGSTGIGVGIQYFPLLDTDAPETCTSDAACGAFGPCFLKFCQNAGPDIFPCSAASECRTQAGEDVGPCTPLTLCWPPPQAATDPLILCHDVSECPAVAGARCVPFNECSGNTDYGCPVAGMPCGTVGGMNLGTCRAFSPTSICLHTSDCSATTYATPAVDIAALPGAAQAVVASITAKMPAGNTPTAPALTGAIDKARSWATAHPDHTVVALLATDGVPTECIANPTTDPSGITGVRSAASAGVSGTPSVSTFVIGVFGPGDTTAQANLNQIAVAGGTKSAFLVDTSGDVSAQFLAALNQIRATKLACEYLLPEAPSGQTLDFNLVNVDFTTGASTERLLAVSQASACDATSGGWYYDQDPSMGGVPTKIMICPATCARFESTQQGSVQIALGCRTQVR